VPNETSALTNIENLLQGTAADGSSSAALNWEGLLVHRRKSTAMERAAMTLDQHYVLVWEDEPSVWERSDGSGPLTRHVKRPGSISIGMAGIQPGVRTDKPMKVIAGLIDPRTVREVALEADLSKLEGRHDFMGGEDAPLAQLIRLSAIEADGGGASGQLYGASLVMAIISRFIHLALQDNHLQPTDGPALSRPRLRRVIDKMNADFNQDLSIETLAGESGYSRAHFMRMFRSATGKSPHRYLQDLRLDYAHQQLGKDVLSITEIAYAAGFSSHSHLTKLFSERYGTTPSLFRRKL
jgi:AraC family transcriptional regulator